MKERDVKVKSPELLNCPCDGENCAIAGCFFQNVIARIDANKLGKVQAEVVKRQFIQWAIECKCFWFWSKRVKVFSVCCSEFQHF